MMKVMTKFKQTDIGIIPAEWEIKKLIDLLFIKGRIGWKGLKKSEFGKKGIIIINGPNIKNGRVDLVNCLRVPKWRHDESQELTVKENDILMTKDGTIGKLAYVEHLPEAATLAGGIFLIRSESKKLNQNFLYHYFNSSFFKSLVESRIEGSVIPHLYQRDIGQLSIPLPSIAEQQIISKILSNLDFKITINQQMNKTLEEIGKSIFKQWFIDFEFPNKSDVPYKSSEGEMLYNKDLEKNIPKMWDVKPLYDCAKYVNGSAFRDRDFSLERSGLPVIKIFELKYGIRQQTNFTIKNVESKYLIENKEILFAWSGSPNTSIDIFIWSGGKAILNQHIFKVNANNSTEKSFIYFLLKYLKKIFIEIARNKQTIGLGHVTLDDMKKMFVVVPDNDTMKKFDNVASPIFEQICHNDINSQICVQLRNSLLPKLMSGKVRVPIKVKK